MRADARHAAAGAAQAAQDVHVRDRLRLLAACAALTVLAFVQAPGRIVADTKLDLTVDPVGFLARAWHLWEPLGASGQLQNQAYGYFLPMGPFFAAGRLLGIAPWILQRAWWAVLLVLACSGVYRLLAALGVGVPATRLIAALGYALSARMVTEIGAASVEVWPMALAPWVLVPLISVRRGHEGRAAARSGLAVAACGGVNAVAVGAVLVLPVLWLLTRSAHTSALPNARTPPGLRDDHAISGPAPGARRRLSAWWALAVVAATLWWLGPLVLLGRYSPPFLDWVESSAVSTSKATLPSAFRGTTAWVAWFRTPEPLWPAGWAVISSTGGILLGWLLVAIALLGLVRRDVPQRAFLVGGSLAGVLLLTAGHVGPLTAPWAPLVQDVLDGVGAPLRNTHKFDLVLRIPLAAGLAHALAVIRPTRLVPPTVRAQRVLQFAAACAVLGTAAPALVGQLPARGSYEEIPGYWRQAAAYLERTDDGARTLLLPGSPFATSLWGDPRDEPLQPLAGSSWAVRDAVPLSSAGNIRLLNVVEQQVATGRGSAGLAELLARSGISRVLVRADLAPSSAPGAPPLPATLRAALEGSPGLTPVARFGPDLVPGAELGTQDLDLPVPALEVWRVQPRDSVVRPAQLFRQADSLRVSGGPEALLSLADAGLLGPRATVLAGDPQARALDAGPFVLTDTPQRREATVGQVRGVYSEVLAPEEAFRLDRAAHDWLPFEQPLTTARPEIVQRATSSSRAASSLGAHFAVDGDPTTSWVSTPLAVGQWLDVTFAEPITLSGTLQVTPGPIGARLASLDARTDVASRRTSLPASRATAGRPAAVQVDVPPGPTRSLRLTVTGTRGGDLQPVSISEVELLRSPTPRRPLALPAAPDVSGGTEPGRTPEGILLRVQRDGADECVVVSDRARCSPLLRRQAEEADLDRIVTLPAAGSYSAEATVRSRSDAEVDRILRPRGRSVVVVGSSRRTGAPAQRPQAAMDGDSETGWVASAADPSPSLTLRWPEGRTVDRMRWHVDPRLPASRPTRLEISGPGGQRLVTPDADGWVRFAALRGDQLRVTVRGIRARLLADPGSAFPLTAPVGASELQVPALDGLVTRQPDAQPVEMPCGAGPVLVAGTRRLSTRVSGTVGDVLRHAPMQVRLCSGTLPLPAGEVRLRLERTAQLQPESLLVTPGGHDGTAISPATISPATDEDTLGWAEHGPESRSATVGPTSTGRILVVHENANVGWRATLRGVELRHVRIDGWQQGWIVPAGTGGTIRLDFAPGRPYRILLLSGAVLLAMLAAAAIPVLRRPHSRQRTIVARVGARFRGGGSTVAGPLPEATGRLPRLVIAGLGASVVVGIGGWWGAAAAIGVLLLVRVGLRLAWLVVPAAAVAALGSVPSLNADVPGAPATAAVAASLALLGCLAVSLTAHVGEANS